MDRINYRRMLPVYLSDIWALEEKNPNIGQFFWDGHFLVQINHIPGIAKEVDHAGEQENKKPEIKGGLVGITRRGNSMNKFFLASYVVSQKKETKKHHALNQNKINIQSDNKISLAGTFDTVKLQFTGREDTRYLLKWRMS